MDRAAPAEDTQPGRPYELLLEGNFLPGEIDVQYAPDRARLHEDLRRLALAEWPARVLRAAREGVSLSNGGLLRLTEFRVQQGRLGLVLGDTTYAEHLASNCTPERHATYPWNALANPLGTSALILTSDAQLVLGLRGAKVMHCRNQAHTIGGMFESIDAASGQVNATDSILREVEEELGTGETDIAHVRCRGLIRDLEHLQPELMFEVELRLTFPELEDHWRHAESKAEHTRLISIPDDARKIRDYLDSEPALAPQARAALDLRLTGMENQAIRR